MQRYPVTVRFPMHWGEMDAFGHANNARYFTWFETARIEYFARIGLTGSPQSGVGPILKTGTCEYRRPVVYPADLIVGIRVTQMGRTSFTTEYAVTLADAPDDPVAVGTGVVVTFDYHAGRAVPVPDAVRAAIEALEGSAPAA